jgi:hypothetical protein
MCSPLAKPVKGPPAKDGRDPRVPPKPPRSRAPASSLAAHRWTSSLVPRAVPLVGGPLQIPPPWRVTVLVEICGTNWTRNPELFQQFMETGHCRGALARPAVRPPKRPQTGVVAPGPPVAVFPGRCPPTSSQGSALGEREWASPESTRPLMVSESGEGEPGGIVPESLTQPARLVCSRDWRPGLASLNATAPSGSWMRGRPPGPLPAQSPLLSLIGPGNLDLFAEWH